jgi:hypothetical protein
MRQHKCLPFKKNVIWTVALSEKFNANQQQNTVDRRPKFVRINEKMETGEQSIIAIAVPLVVIINESDDLKTNWP